MNDNLEEVKRNRVALNFKIRSVFINENTLVYHFPHLDIRFVFRSSRRISSFFPFKDKVPKYSRSSVLYLFNCQCCSASYVGKTTRHLHTRKSVHLGISPITGKHSTNPAISSILSHTNASGHPASFGDFQILSSSSDSYKLTIHESSH